MSSGSLAASQVGITVQRKSRAIINCESPKIIGDVISKNQIPVYNEIRQSRRRENNGSRPSPDSELSFEHRQHAEGPPCRLHDRLRNLRCGQPEDVGLGRPQPACPRLDAGQYGDCAECGDAIAERRLLAVPFAVGDTYQNQRIVGTLPSLFGIAEDGSPMPDERAFKYRPGKRYELSEGRVFHPGKFEAVIGSDITKITGLKLGDKFKATHGGSRPGQAPDEHDTQWTVVGVLKPTKTANDRVLFIPLLSFYAISEHDDALEAISKYRPQAEAPTPTRLATTFFPVWLR